MVLNLGSIDEGRLVYDVKRAYDSQAGKYTNYSGNIDLQFNHLNSWIISDKVTEEIIARHLSLMNLKDANDFTIADLGCGDGAWSLRLASMYPNIRVIGVDISDELIKIAKDRAENLGLTDRCKFFVGDIRNLRPSMPDNCVDYIISLYDPLNHIPNPRFNALKEFLRILKPGGYVFASVHSRADFGFYVCDVNEVDGYMVANLENYGGEVIIFKTKDGKIHKVYSKRYTFEELKYEFEFAGFEVIEGYGIDVYAKKKLEGLLKTYQLSQKELKRIIARLYLDELRIYKDPLYIDKAIHIGILARKPKK